MSQRAIKLAKEYGINIVPGSEDDGWVSPAPVMLEDGTQVKLYKDGEALQAAYSKIEQAKDRVLLEVYIFAEDATGRAFCDLLCAKAREGVRVYVIYDSFGSMRTNRNLFRQMRRNGVRLQEFHPIRPWECHFSWRPFNRDHRKLLIVDYDTAWLGGLNIGAEYAGSWVLHSEKVHEFWRDNAIGLVGNSAKYFTRSFSRTWNYVQTGGRIVRAEYAHGIESHRRWGVVKKGDDPREPWSRPCDLGVLASVPTVDSPLRPMLTKLFSEATESIQMTMAYFAPDDELISSLCSAAKRGVKVELMLPAKTDAGLLLIAARAFYEKLLTAGVHIYERQKVVLHAKTMVIDSKISLFGSTNLDYRSIEYNCELSVILRNALFGRQMNDLFANDIRYARRITLKDWRRRPYSDRIVQWAVIHARQLL